MRKYIPPFFAAFVGYLLIGPIGALIGFCIWLWMATKDRRHPSY